ncbi:MAG TPA: allophanate hydrolase [Gammaproteobacteria bacterium]|nr:allophanate hydrolase [bacterium BMS3Abin11]HDH15651.1 allophanate hydrolase [Gammaproteobacteria bacterium]
MNLNIAYLHDAYKNKTLTPEQLLESIWQACEQLVDHNIWIHLLSQQELQPYLDNLLKKGIEEFPLYGIPFAIKDNIDLAGIPTTAACQAFSYTPEKSAFVVEQLINAGAIPVGKTNMDQFATGLVGTRSPAPWGACKNAFNKDYISGGSSSGSSVSVALGLVSFSLGTDTAGSGRVPASFNNLIGFKPSKGLLSMSGVVPACRSLDCVSIFALTSDDADAVFEQAAVYDVNDQYAKQNPFSNNGRQYGLPTETFTFVVPQQDQLEFFGDTSAQKLFDQSVRAMQALGGEKHELDFTPFLQAAKLLYEGPWVAERYVAIENIISNQPEELLPVIKTIIGSAENKKATEAFKAEYSMQKHRSQVKQLLTDVDFLMTPTAGTIYTIEEVNADPIKLNINLGYYTNFMNLLDCTSVAVPAGFLDNGLPWGISLVSTCMQDRKLLSFANRWQQHLQLRPGKQDQDLPMSQAAEISFSDTIPVIVCGAHLDGLAFNWQLSERGAVFQEKTLTSETYRMYLIDGSPQRPGLIRDEVSGKAIEIEIWQIPAAEFGSFVAHIAAPLGIGKVETINHRWLPGFICESYAVKNAKEISVFGSWREYLRSLTIFKEKNHGT